MFNPIHKATKHIDRGKKNHISPAINTEMRVGKAFLKKSVVMVKNEDKKQDSDIYSRIYKMYSLPLVK